MVVDDDRNVSELVAAALGEEHVPVLCAAGGAEALALLDRTLAPPALILLDLLMPEGDGAAFARAYLGRPGPHAPIVLFTAMTPPNGLVDELGVAETLSKPFEITELLALAARHVPRVAD